MASLLHPSFLLQNGFTEGSKYQRDLYKLKRKLKPLLQTSSPPKHLRHIDGDGRKSVAQNQIILSSPSNSEPAYKNFDTCSDPSSDERNRRKPGQFVEQSKSQINSLQHVEIIDISHNNKKHSNEVYSNFLVNKDTVKSPASSCLAYNDTVKQPLSSPVRDDNICSPKIRSEHSMINGNPPSLIDVEDIYVCTDCQPKQLLIGMELSNHCSENPSHFNIDPLSDPYGAASPESSINTSIKLDHSKMTSYAIDKIIHRSAEYNQTYNIKSSESDDHIAPLKYLKIVPIHTLL